MNNSRSRIHAKKTSRGESISKTRALRLLRPSIQRTGKDIGTSSELFTRRASIVISKAGFTAMTRDCHDVSRWILCIWPQGDLQSPRHYGWCKFWTEMTVWIALSSPLPVWWPPEVCFLIYHTCSGTETTLGSEDLFSGGISKSWSFDVEYILASFSKLATSSSIPPGPEVISGLVVGHRDIFAPGVVLQELKVLFCKFSLTFASATTPVQVDVRPDIP